MLSKVLCTRVQREFFSLGHLEPSTRVASVSRVMIALKTENGFRTWTESYRAEQETAEETTLLTKHSEGQCDSVCGQVERRVKDLVIRQTTIRIG